VGSAATRLPGQRGLLAGYAALCLLCGVLYAMAGTEWQRGAWQLWDGAYEAVWNLAPPMAIGLLALPWVRWLQRRPRNTASLLLLHGLGALAFVLLWQGTDYLLAHAFYGADHAQATLEQRVLWRAMWGVFGYLALVFGFGGALHARRAQAAAVSAARAEAALVRAELAAISGKLNPHFLFNTLNSLLMLTRRDPARAEQALLGFARMMRYVLDTSRGAGDRVPLRDDLAFVRDYLALESLRLGDRLRVEWHVTPEAEDAEIPPLTLQPLVENAVVHGLSGRVEGGLLQLHARLDGGLLHLRVVDDGVGCQWPPEPDPAPASPRATPAGARRGGVGLAALRRRFELDYDGAASFQVRSAPGQGCEITILIPQTDTTA
jgi:anti-sigma regulatory factor (Ser/Thr protein kinase)